MPVFTLIQYGGCSCINGHFKSYWNQALNSFYQCLKISISNICILKVNIDHHMQSWFTWMIQMFLLECQHTKSYKGGKIWNEMYLFVQSSWFHIYFHHEILWKNTFTVLHKIKVQCICSTLCLLWRTSQGSQLYWIPVIIWRQLTC